jgi:putative flippase GtrA
MTMLLSDLGARRADTLPVTTPPPMRRTALEFMRYFIASAGALAADFALYRLALGLGIAYPIAALIGFSAGAVVAYLASVAWVFETRTLRRSGVEFCVFVAIGVAGLGLTEALLWLQIGHLGLSPMWSKVGAAGVVFAFNFGLRKCVLFRSRVR